MDLLVGVQGSKGNKANLLRLLRFLTYVQVPQKFDKPRETLDNMMQAVIRQWKIVAVRHVVEHEGVLLSNLGCACVGCTQWLAQIYGACAVKPAGRPSL